jgi:hypothetical protein
MSDRERTSKEVIMQAQQLRQQTVLEDVVMGVLAAGTSRAPDSVRDDDRLVALELIGDDLVQLVENGGFHDAVDRTEVDFVRLDPDSDLGGTDEAAVTNRFQRFSSPYLRVDIEPLRELGRRRPRSTTYARTVTGRRSFDPQWFDIPEVALIAIEEPEPTERKESWWWLAISLAVAGAVIAWITW